MLNFFRRKKPEVPPAAPNDSRATEAAIPPRDSNAMAADAPAAAGPLATEPVPAEFIAAAMEVEPAPAPAPEPVLVPAAEAADEPAAPGRKGWRDRLRGSAFARSLGGLFSSHPRLDDELLDEIETALLTADVGVTATTQIVDDLRGRMKAREFADAPALLAALRADLVGLLRPVAQPLAIDRAAKPFVLLTVGVNGVGKTTTIGK